MSSPSLKIGLISILFDNFGDQTLSKNSNNNFSVNHLNCYVQQQINSMCLLLWIVDVQFSILINVRISLGKLVDKC